MHTKAQFIEAAHALSTEQLSDLVSELKTEIERRRGGGRTIRIDSFGEDRAKYLKIIRIYLKVDLSNALKRVKSAEALVLSAVTTGDIEQLQAGGCKVVIDPLLRTRQLTGVFCFALFSVPRYR